MATTSPDNIRTPNPTDPYNLVADLAILAGDVQSALALRGNRYIGSAAQMNAFAAPDGTEWFNTTDNITYVRRGGVWSGGTWNITPASGFSGTISAFMSRGLVEIIVNVTGTVGSSAHVTLASSVPAEIRPPSGRRGGILYLGGVRYGAGVVLATGLLAVANLSSIAGGEVQGSIVYRVY